MDLQEPKMPHISLLVKLNRDGIAKLADSTAYLIAPDQEDYTAEWTPGTEIIVKENPDDQEWQYKLFSSGGGIPVKAAPYTPAPSPN
jgi:hypothetical protein